MMNAWKHFKTITTHKILVMRYCFKIGLYKQGLLHDLSKYSWTEFRMGCRHYQGTRSPNNAEREASGISTSWLHHKGRNKHHYEYWVDYGIQCDTVITGMEMPRKYVAEMIIDRICACKVYANGTYSDQAAVKYYENGKDRLWFIHKKTKAQMEFLLRMLAEKGEDYTLHYIRYVFLRNGKNRRNSSKREFAFRRKRDEVCKQNGLFSGK